MKRLFTILLACWGLLFASSCDKQDYSGQDLQIQKFIESQLNSNPEYTAVSKSGVWRLTTLPGEGEELNSKGKARISYAGYIFNGSISQNGLFATNNESLAGSWKLSREDQFEPIIVDLSDENLLNGLRIGLTGVKAGEECTIVFNAGKGQGNMPVGTIPANSALAYKIWVDEIEND